MAKTVTLLLLTLVIDRDATTKLPVQVFYYELPILEELFADGAVITEKKSEPFEVQNFDEAEVFAGLKNKYGSTAEGAEALKAAYRNERVFSKAVASSIAAAKEEPAANEQDAEDEDDQEDQSSDLETLAGKTIADIEAALDGLTDEELRELADIEKAGKDRKGVLEAIERALGEGQGDTE